MQCITFTVQREIMVIATYHTQRPLKSYQNLFKGGILLESSMKTVCKDYVLTYMI